MLAMPRRNDKEGRQKRPRAALGSLAAGLAHEIRNPLAAMSINLQMLEEDLESSGQARDLRLIKRVRILEREVARLEQILANFQQYARGFNLEPTRIQINPLLREIVALWAEGAKKAGIDVELVLASDLPDVSVDPTYFHKAVLNLLINAQHAIQNREGPELERSEQIVLGSRRAQGAVEVLVIDTGPGIADDKLRSIFEPYFSTKGTGSGLGLPMSRRILEEHGGTLTVESEVGRGTSFRILLPSVEAPVAEEGEGEPSPDTTSN